MLYSEFIDRIICNCHSAEESCIEILRARGFLIDQDENGYFLSDNSYLRNDLRKNDLDFLNEILLKYNVGEMHDKYIHINSDAEIKSMQGIFEGRYMEDMCFPNTTKNKFIISSHGRKVPVSILDPFVARYIKAVSACGVDTKSSCDGNHNGGSFILIEPNGKWFSAWHQVICKYILSDKYDLQWDEECKKIKFNRNKLEIYFQLNKAAEFLYDSREKLRKTKEMLSEEIINNSDIGKNKEYIISVFESALLSDV